MSVGVERVDGLAVYRRDATAAGVPGLAVVTVHGAMDRGAAFAELGRRLPEHPVVRYDRRGYARSAALAPAPDIESSVTDLARVGDGRRCVVVGHSMGGIIALALADRRPDLVSAVVVLEAPMPWEPWCPSPMGSAALDPTPSAEDAAEAFLRRMLGDTRWERLPTGTRQRRRAEGAALLADLVAARAGRPFDPAALDVPVIVGMGADTDDHHQRACAELAASVTDAERVTVPGARHDLHVSHPGAVADMVHRASARVGASVVGAGTYVRSPHR